MVDERESDYRWREGGREEGWLKRKGEKWKERRKEKGKERKRMSN